MALTTTTSGNANTIFSNSFSGISKLKRRRYAICNETSWSAGQSENDPTGGIGFEDSTRQRKLGLQPFVILLFRGIYCWYWKYDWSIASHLNPIFGSESMSHPVKKILFLVPYPLGIAASQRFRFEQYFEILRQNGIDYDLQPFLSHHAFKILYSRGNLIGKLWYTFTGFLRRAYIMLRLGRYDFVSCIERPSPWVFPFSSGSSRNWLVRKWSSILMMPFGFGICPRVTLWSIMLSVMPMQTMVARAHKVSAGNRYLADQASNSMRMSSSIQQPLTQIITTIGWGVWWFGCSRYWLDWHAFHHSVPRFSGANPQGIGEGIQVQVCCIADHEPEFKLDSLEFLKWSKESETMI